MNNYNFKMMSRLISIVVFFGLNSIHAVNPIITHIRSADPSAHVWADGKMWLYCSHDQNDATDYSSMDGYHVFSSSNLVNWTDHGEVLHSKDVSWGIAEGGWMWAPDCAFKNGTYYFYFPHKNKNGGWVTGVATSTKPEGPFKDIGRYIDGTSGTDPCCFVDDDGQAYLYFGAHKVAKLKDNMTELAEKARTVNYGSDNFQEGVWVYKRNNLYYYTYTRWQSPDNGGHYATGDSPYGPFKYQGKFSPGPPGAQDHHSIVEYHGKWYYFYHVGNYNGGSSKRRNVCIDYLYYNQDGTIKTVKYTNAGVDPVDPVNVAITNTKITGNQHLPFWGQQYNEPDIFTLQGRKINSCNASDLMTGAHNLGSQIVILHETRGTYTRYSIRIGR